MTTVCIIGCELTPGLEPLQCSCGKHSARLQPAGPKKRKWEVFEVKKEGNKPRRVTMRAEKDSAISVVIDLCKGVYEKKNQPAAATGVICGLRHQEIRTVQYSEATTRASRVAGPGRGRKGERVTSDGAVDEAERVLKKPKPSEQEWRHALGRLTQEHKLLQQWCEQVALRCRIHHSIVNCSIVNYRAVAN